MNHSVKEYFDQLLKNLEKNLDINLLPVWLKRLSKSIFIYYNQNRYYAKDSDRRYGYCNNWAVQRENS
jgi:hypothetical protein